MNYIFGSNEEQKFENENVNNNTSESDNDDDLDMNSYNENNENNENMVELTDDTINNLAIDAVKYGMDITMEDITKMNINEQMELHIKIENIKTEKWFNIPSNISSLSGIIRNSKNLKALILETIELEQFKLEDFIHMDNDTQVQWYNEQSHNSAQRKIQKHNNKNNNENVATNQINDINGQARKKRKTTQIHEQQKQKQKEKDELRLQRESQKQDIINELLTYKDEYIKMLEELKMYLIKWTNFKLRI